MSEKSTWWKLQEKEPEVFRPYSASTNSYTEHLQMRQLLSPQDFSHWLADKRQQEEQYKDHLYWEYAVKLDYKKSEQENIFVLQCQTCEEVVAKVHFNSFGVCQEEVRQHSVKQYKKHYRIRHSRWRRVR